MNQFDAIDLLYKVSQELDNKQLGEAMKLIGMTEDLFPEGAEFSELLEVFQVRLNDVMKIAGIK